MSRVEMAGKLTVREEFGMVRLIYRSVRIVGSKMHLDRKTLCSFTITCYCVRFNQV